MSLLLGLAVVAAPAPPASVLQVRATAQATAHVSVQIVAGRVVDFRTAKLVRSRSGETRLLVQFE